MQTGNKKFVSGRSSSSVKPEKLVLLKPFGNQVSGRANILEYNASTICKPYVSRELFFYSHLPSVFNKFVPEFQGLINVTYVDYAKENSVVAFANTKTLLPKNSAALKSLVEIPRPHSKRCVQDYGKTHVIDPQNPVIVSLRPKPGSGKEFTSTPDSDVDRLTQGFNAHVSIQTFDGRECRVEWRSVENEETQANPWNSKVMGDVWTKIKSVKSDEKVSTKSKRFMLMENVTAAYKRPCVLDLKVGTRVRESASLSKLARHVTAIDVGVRMSGMQIYNPERKEFVYVNKYYGHNLSVDGLISNLVDFFSRGQSAFVRLGGDVKKNKENTLGNSSVLRSKMDLGLLNSSLLQLKELRRAVACLLSYRFYSGSLLFIYEGDQDKSGTNLSSSSFYTPSCEAQMKSPLSRGQGKSNNGRSEDVGTPLKNSSISKGNLGQDSLQTLQNTSKTDCTYASKKIANPSLGRRKPHTESCSPLSACCGPIDDGSSSPDDSSASSCENRSSVDVRLIDFAHFCYNDPVIHPGSDGGFLFGIDNLIGILENMKTKGLSTLESP